MKALLWLRDRAVWLLATAVAVLTAGWLYRIERDKRRSLQDQLKVEQAKRKIADHRARRDALMKQDQVDEARVKQLDEQITDLRLKAVQVTEKVAIRDAAALAKRFNELYDG